MSRNSLTIHHRPYLIGIAVLFCVLLILPDYSFEAEDAGDTLQQFLKNDMPFSEKDFDDLNGGKTISKILKTDTKHEVGIISIAKINVSKEFFLRNYREKGMNMETASAGSWGIISTPLN